MYGYVKVNQGTLRFHKEENMITAQTLQMYFEYDSWKTSLLGFPI